MSSEHKVFSIPFLSARPFDHVLQIYVIICYGCIFVFSVAFSKSICRIKPDNRIAIFQKRLRHRLNMRLLLKSPESVHHESKADLIFPSFNQNNYFLALSIFYEFFHIFSRKNLSKSFLAKSLKSYSKISSIGIHLTPSPSPIIPSFGVSLPSSPPPKNPHLFGNMAVLPSRFCNKIKFLFSSKRKQAAPNFLASSFINSKMFCARFDHV